MKNNKTLFLCKLLIKMKNSPYIPVSQYLHTVDVNNESIPVKNRFYFFSDQQNFFFVYKSLACFLSPKAQNLISKRLFQFQIRITNILYNPKFVINSLVSLLSGHPICVNSSTFLLFHKI
jgi:hypothetical protein